MPHHDHCLRHLPKNQRADYLFGLEPGADVDLRGTQLSHRLLRALLDAVEDNLGAASFAHARFTGVAVFDRTTFGGFADFSHAHFDDDASFVNATFGGYAAFGATRFDGQVRFDYATFDARAWLGPLVAHRLDLEGARFEGPTEIAGEAVWMSAKRARFHQTVRMRLRYTVVSLHGAVFGGAASLSGSDRPFLARDGQEVVARPELPRRNTAPDPVAWMPSLVTLRTTDVSNLLISDVDLAWCQFAGVHRLDKLQIEGRCPLNNPPSGWRWTRRAVIAEEHFWRGWTAEHPVDETSKVGPERLAPLYRSLRKAFEDSKNEAGAGDFYYGEMEARRHSLATRRTERWILSAYWLLSGYGQRAGRALVALAVLLTIVTTVLVGWGLPAPSPQRISGTVQTGQAALTVVEPPAVLPPAGQRWTAARAERAVQIALGALVFRDAGQRLTPAGTWIVMVARIGGPLLLALAVLAVRARVKR